MLLPPQFAVNGVPAPASAIHALLLACAGNREVSSMRVLKIALAGIDDWLDVDHGSPIDGLQVADANPVAFDADDLDAMQPDRVWSVR